MLIIQKKIVFIKVTILAVKLQPSCFQIKKIKSFVQAGSCAEYGKIKSPQNEKMPCRPVSYYGKAKLLATKHLIKLHKKAFPFTVVRLYQVYGPGQETNRIIPFAIKSAKNNKTFLVRLEHKKRFYLRR